MGYDSTNVMLENVPDAGISFIPQLQLLTWLKKTLRLPTQHLDKLNSRLFDTQEIIGPKKSVRNKSLNVASVIEMLRRLGANGVLSGIAGAQGPATAATNTAHHVAATAIADSAERRTPHVPVFHVVDRRSVDSLQLVRGKTFGVQSDPVCLHEAGGEYF